MYVGSHNDFKVWLNGTLIYQSLTYHSSADYTDFLPVTLKQGRNVLGSSELSVEKEIAIGMLQ